MRAVLCVLLLAWPPGPARAQEAGASGPWARSTWTVLSLGEERLRVVQHVDVTSTRQGPVALPEDGLRVRLPEGATGFQSDGGRGGVRIAQTDEGFALRGAIAPGSTRLVWAFEVPSRGGSLDLDVPLPFPSLEVGVEARAAGDLTLAVAGLPAVEERHLQGQRVLVTQRRYTLADGPPGAISLRVGGLPGPGPGRWVALALALLFLLGGAFALIQRPGTSGSIDEALARRREELLDEAETLARQLASEEIGPRYHARKIDAIRIALAQVLRRSERSTLT